MDATQVDDLLVVHEGKHVIVACERERLATLVGEGRVDLGGEGVVVASRLAQAWLMPQPCPSMGKKAALS